MPKSDIDRARKVLDIEAAGLAALAATLGNSFSDTVDLLQGVKGRIIVTGMGKSGHIANKIAATLSSTGKPAYFVHPGEASHGDLGVVGRDDGILALSNSGETPELSDLVAYSRRFKIPLIGVTSVAGSTLAIEADVVLILPDAEEACPMGLAPTTSTTMTLALGDALAVVLMDREKFTADDFRLRHPGGQLGKRLLKVSDIMHADSELPFTGGGSRMADIIVEMTAKSLGCICILDKDGRMEGVITDGDLRRHMGNDLMHKTAREIMNANPKSIRPSALASEAVQIMNDSAITNLFVIEDDKVVGVLHIHDCLRAGVV
jgi:arabinose-5-phosphate isomerase